MSKFSKRFLIVCLCSIVLGGILYGVGRAFGGSGHYYYSPKDGFIDAGKWGKRVSDSADLPSFDRISINADYSDIVISEGDSFAVEYSEILYEGDEPDQDYWRVEDGCFICDRKKRSTKRGVVEINLGFNWFDFVNTGYSEDNYIHLTVPRGTELTGVLLESSFGDISLSNVTAGEKIEINSNNGDIKLENISSPELKVVSSFGDTKISKTHSDTVRVETQSGDIELGSSSLGNLYLKNEFGSVDIKDCNSEEGELILGSAELDAERLNVENGFTIEEKFGELAFKDCSMGYGKWNSENGDISAENLIVKEKLEAETKFGDISLRMKDGLAPYRYECYTHFGEVSVNGDDKGGKENGGSGTIPLILESDSGDVVLK